MPGCILRASGENFEVDSFLAASTLRPYAVHRRGEVSRKAEPFTNSGIKVDVSKAGKEFAENIADAIGFLEEHEKELERLRAFAGISDIRLDFGVFLQEAVARFYYLPPELVSRAGELGIGIELSCYAVSEDE